MKAKYTFYYNFFSGIVIFMLICSTVYAQDHFILKGTISDTRDNNNLIGVSVLVNGKASAITDAKGFYQLKLTGGKYEITFRYIGYTEKKETLEITSDHVLDIKLTESSGQLDQVVVSAGRFDQEVKRVTVSTEVIKPYMIENKVTTNLMNFMDQVPGVNVVDGQMNIRGGSGWTYGVGSRVLVMLDDIPFLSGDAGQVQWKFIPTENLQQMEVIKGASSVLYGSSALNGIINIRTADPKDKPVTSITPVTGWYSKPSIDSMKWTNDLQMQRGFNAFHSRKIKQLDLTLTLNYLKDDGYRFGEDDDRIRLSFKTKYHSKKIAGLTYGLNGSIMYETNSSFLLWNGYPQGALLALNNEKSVDHSYNTSIDPHADFYTYGIKHRIRMRYMNIINNLQGPPPDTINQDNSSWLLYGEYQLQKELPRQLGMVTGGVAGTIVESNSPLYQGLHSSTNFAPFVQIDLRYKRISFSAGSRYENFKMNEEKDSRMIYRSGLNIEVTKSTFFRTSYGQGYRYPSIAERYIQTTVGSVNIFPNAQLLPESGWNAEAGIKQGFAIYNWKGFADAAYFVTQYDNMVEFNFGLWRSLPTFFTLNDLMRGLGFKSLNIGKTQISGLDLSLGGQGKIGAIEVRLVAGYTYMVPVSLEPDRIYGIDSLQRNLNYKTTSTDTSGNILKYRYEQLAKFDVQIGYKKISFGISMRYNSYMKNIDKIFTDPLFATSVPGIERARTENTTGDYIWDTRAGIDINKNLKAGVSISNIFNHTMMGRPTDMRPPRLVMFQLTIRI